VPTLACSKKKSIISVQFSHISTSDRHINDQSLANNPSSTQINKSNKIKTFFFCKCSFILQFFIYCILPKEQHLPSIYKFKKKSYDFLGNALELVYFVFTHIILLLKVKLVHFGPHIYVPLLNASSHYIHFDLVSASLWQLVQEIKTH
jgi:hypothetical protein